MTQISIETGNIPVTTTDRGKDNEKPVLAKRLGLTLLARMRRSPRFTDIPDDDIFYLGPYYAGGAADDQNEDRVRLALKQIEQDKERAKKFGVQIDKVVYEVGDFVFKTKMISAHNLSDDAYNMSDDIVIGILAGKPRA